MITLSINKNVSTNSDFSDMERVLRTTFKKVFPKGWINVGPSDGTTTIVSLGLIGGTRSEKRSYDPMYHVLFLSKIDTDLYTLELRTGGIYVRSGSDKNLDLTKLTTRFRKLSGSAETVWSGFSAFLVKLKQLVVDNGQNIYGREHYDDKFFA